MIEITNDTLKSRTIHSSEPQIEDNVQISHHNNESVCKERFQDRYINVNNKAVP